MRRGRLIWRRSARIDKVAAISLLPELAGAPLSFLSILCRFGEKLFPAEALGTHSMGLRPVEVGFQRKKAKRTRS